MSPDVGASRTTQRMPARIAAGNQNSDGVLEANAGPVRIGIGTSDSATLEDNSLNASKPLRLSQKQRVRSSGDFRRCYNGIRAGDAHLLVFAIRNEKENTRVGVSVSKKHGNAVKRNRKKRLLRETYRGLQHDLPQGFDLVLVPRQRADSELGDFQSSLKELTRRLLSRMELPRTQEEASS